MPLTTQAAQQFIKAFCGASAAFFALCALFICLLDPFGVFLRGQGKQRPIMDINQRYMYPQLARSGLYDSLVIGSSTSRLLDPDQLNAAFGGRFANLAMNAATAWEQTELLKLAQRHGPALGTVILGIDDIWCLDEKNLLRKTFRGFPDWMYDDNRWNDAPQMVNLTTLEIAGRLLAHHVGLIPERIRRDGFEVFTPPEQNYDLARARFHIWSGSLTYRVTPVIPPVALSAQQRDALTFPALGWLEERLAALPPSTRRLIVFMPVHVAAQAIPGSQRAAELDVCRNRITALAARHATRVIDFSIASSITTRDENYWDALHYRLPIADIIVRELKQAEQNGMDSPDGLYKVR